MVAMYQGKYSKSTDVGKQIFEECTTPFISLQDDIEKRQNFQFNLDFDFLFTSMSLLEYLRLKGYHGAGTIIPNRHVKIVSKRNAQKIISLRLTEVLTLYSLGG